MVKNSGLLDHLGGDPDEIPATPKYNYENVIDVSCGEAFWITDDLALQFMGYLPDEEGQTNLFYLSNDYDRALQLLSDGTITIDDEDGDTYVVPNVSYDWIRLDAPSDVQWQTLHMEKFTEGVITVRDLYPADDSMSEWVWMIPNKDADSEFTGVVDTGIVKSRPHSQDVAFRSDADDPAYYAFCRAGADGIYPGAGLQPAGRVGKRGQVWLCGAAYRRRL